MLAGTCHGFETFSCESQKLLPLVLLFVFFLHSKTKQCPWAFHRFTPILLIGTLSTKANSQRIDRLYSDHIYSPATDGRYHETGTMRETVVKSISSHVSDETHPTSPSIQWKLQLSRTTRHASSADGFLPGNRASRSSLTGYR